jgi:hypothetical protein
MTRYWKSAVQLDPFEFVCGHCDKFVGSAQGYYETDGANRTGPLIYICPNCRQPTYVTGQRRVPGPAFGNNVEHLPSGVAELYDEARRCMSISAYTSAILDCRKLLAHVAVDQDAPPGESFLKYVEYLADNGFVPPNGRAWVDVIRKKGNEANHEIVLMGRADAEQLLSFAEMLLKFVYEFPAKVPPAPPA